jgi:hypothetical protein
MRFARLFQTPELVLLTDAAACGMEQCERHIQFTLINTHKQM